MAVHGFDCVQLTNMAKRAPGTDSHAHSSALGAPLEPVVRLPEHPCYCGDGDWDHEWIFQDESFDHEFGTERVWYWECSTCGVTREYEHEDDDPCDWGLDAI